jgi:hypothetical protein
MHLHDSMKAGFTTKAEYRPGLTDYESRVINSILNPKPKEEVAA